MKNFKQFINEGVRHLSDKTLRNLPPEQKLKYGCIHDILWLVKLSIEEGANIHQNDDEPILISCNYGYVEITKYLLDNGVNVHLKDDYLLRYACNSGEFEIVKLLIDNDANIHTQNDKPLRWASEKGHIDIVKYLIEKGANIHAKNDMALKVAIDNNHIEVAKLLKNYVKINEGVRNLMKPKTKDEVLKSLNANPNREFKRSKQYGSGFLIGTVNTTYDNLVKLFGEPKGAYISDGEQLFSWNVVSDDGHILEIYDRYSGFTKKELMKKEYNWHIGGRFEQDAKDLTYFIYKNTLYNEDI